MLAVVHGLALTLLPGHVSAALQSNLSWADQSDLADALLKVEQVRHEHQQQRASCLLTCSVDAAGSSRYVAAAEH